MKFISKKGIVCSLALLLAPMTLMAGPVVQSIDDGSRAVQLAYNGCYGYGCGYRTSWYEPVGCRTVQVYRRACVPTTRCSWDYGCKPRCYVQPTWEKRCW